MMSSDFGRFLFGAGGKLSRMYEKLSTCK